MGKKYITKITAKQQKFIDIYTSKYGELSATDCAIKAGYDRGSAHTRASELLNWRTSPEVVEEIKGKVQGFYVDRNLTLTKELTNDDIHEKMKDIFKTREEYEAMHKSLAEELFGPDGKKKFFDEDEES